MSQNGYIKGNRYTDKSSLDHTFDCKSLYGGEWASD